MYCIDYVFYFTFIFLTSDSNHVWNNSYYSACKHLNLLTLLYLSFHLPYFLFFFSMAILRVIKDQTKLSLRFSCCHFNVSSLVEHNLPKLHLLEGYNSLDNYDFIYIYLKLILIPLLHSALIRCVIRIGRFPLQNPLGNQLPLRTQPLLQGSW